MSFDYRLLKTSCAEAYEFLFAWHLYFVKSQTKLQRSTNNLNLRTLYLLVKLNGLININFSTLGSIKLELIMQVWMIQRGNHILGETCIGWSGKSANSKYFSQWGKEEGQYNWEVGIRGDWVLQYFERPCGDCSQGLSLHSNKES